MKLEPEYNCYACTGWQYECKSYYPLENSSLCAWKKIADTDVIKAYLGEGHLTFEYIEDIVKREVEKLDRLDRSRRSV